MKLTFGKFEGWDTDDLAKAGEVGRDYLQWCSRNLRSPKWRRECERVLKSNSASEIDEHLATEAIVVDSGDISYSEAQIFARDEIAQREEDDQLFAAMERAKEQVVAEFAGKMDVAEAKLRQLQSQYEFGGWERLSPRNFSSQEKYEQFVAFMEATEEATEVAYRESRGY